MTPTLTDPSTAVGTATGSDGGDSTDDTGNVVSDGSSTDMLLIDFR